MTSDLILVGASVRAAACSALRAGFRPYAIDQFADRDLAAICPAVRIRRYPHDLVSAVGDAPPAPWIYTGGLENHPRLVDRLAAIRPLWGNRGGVLCRVRDPFLLAEVVRESGLEVPVILRELDPDDSRGQVTVWLKKPLRSSGGHKIQIAPPGTQAARRGFYYQSFVRGQPHGAVFLATDDACQLLGVSRQIQANFGDFRYHGSIVAPGAWHTNVALLARLGQTLADRFSLRGLFNLDFVSSPSGVWPLEVNPRYSASVELLERATGIHFLTLHASVFDPTRRLPGSSRSIPAPIRAIGKAIVYAESNGRIPPQFCSLAADWNDDPRWPTIADLPAVGDCVVNGQPICTVFAEADAGEEVQRQLSERVQRVLKTIAGAV